MIKTLTKTYVVINDLQIPFQDKKATELVINFTRDLAPDGIVLNGDIVDCYPISDFVRSPGSHSDIMVEVGQAARLMKSLQGIGIKVWVGGNHEDRMRRYQWKRIPELANHPNLTFPELFHLSEFGFDWLEYGDAFMLGKLMVTHGDIVSKHSAWSGKMMLDKYGTSIMMGHCFDTETEILTPIGWIRQENLIPGKLVMTFNRQNNCLEWQACTEVFRYNNYDRLSVLDARDINLMVTGDHGLWVSPTIKHGQDIWCESTATKAMVYNEAKYRLTGNYMDGGIALSLPWIRVLAWIMAEGHVSVIDDVIRSVRIAQSDAPDGRLTRLRDDLNAAGLRWSEKKRYVGGTSQHGQHRNFDAYRLGLLDIEKFRDTIEAYLGLDKTPSFMMRQMSAIQAKEFLETYIVADGSINSSAKNSCQIASKREDHIDFLQMLACLGGYRTSIAKNNGMYYLTMNTRQTTEVTKQRWSVEPYKGTVWCTSVPNGTLLIRRNGHTAITLNTHRLGVHFKTDVRGPHGAWENGCLCSLKPEYVRHPNWQQGFSVVHVKQNGFYIVQQIPILPGPSFMYGKDEIK